MNQGYGKIHPRNCLIKGQATNLHINSLITKNRQQISLYVLTLEDEQKIKRLEEAVLHNRKPDWNIQL
jgi:hypothetical protein